MLCTLTRIFRNLDGITRHRADAKCADKACPCPTETSAEGAGEEGEQRVEDLIVTSPL